MMIKQPKTPNLTARTVIAGGEEVVLYRWNPGPALRRAGFKGVDLWADGPAMTAAEIAAKGFDAARFSLRHRGRRPMALGPAAKLARQLTAAARGRTSEARNADASAPPIVRRRALKTADLIDDYLKALAAAVAAGETAPKTAANYRAYAKSVREWIGAEAPAALTKETATVWLRAVKAKRGEHAALKSGAMLTRIFKWAEARDKWASLLPLDPRAYREFGLTKPAARLRVALPEEVETLLMAFDNPAALYAASETPLGERTLTPAPSMGDALVAMLWSAARVGDALSFREAHFASGRLVYRQAKTGRICNLPVIEALAARLPAMRARAAATRKDGEGDALIVNEEDGLPYWRARAKTALRDHRPYNARWTAYRALAGKKTPSLIGEGENALGERWTAFNAQDCRDTAVSRLALATDSIVELASWHGSDPEEIARLARHYIAVDPAHATRAGEKLAALCRQMEIAV